jgi:hypothetical protein
MTSACYSISCAQPATKALEIAGWPTWPDGRTRYVYACEADLGKVLAAQATRDNTVTVHDYDESMPNGCVAAWGSHSCSFTDDHTGEHVCSAISCGSSPGDYDKVFSFTTFEPCTRVGGVKG